MKKYLFSKFSITTFTAVMIFSLIFSTGVSAATQSNTISDEELNAIENSLLYNTMTGTYVFDEEKSQKLGLTKNQSLNLNNFFENMTKEEVKNFNKLIGFDPQKYNGSGEISVMAPPLLIPILSFLGGAAAGKILDEVMNYGIAKACENLHGNWNLFDDFCETNGHI